MLRVLQGKVFRRRRCCRGKEGRGGVECGGLVLSNDAGVVRKKKLSMDNCSVFFLRSWVRTGCGGGGPGQRGGKPKVVAMVGK